MSFDLDAASREALELDAVLAHVAGFASTSPGRRAILAASPSSYAGDLAAEHAAVAEAGDHLERFGRLLPARVPDPSPALEGLAVDGLVVPPLTLRDLASALIEAAALRKRLGAIEGDGFPSLKALGRGIPDLTSLAAEVAAHVAADGRIEDGASPELRRIRVAIAKTGERLRRQLESFVHDPAAASVVRDDFVTQRNGRYVIPVRADTPHPVDGIVHAASSSGQTLFVEPIESVGLNNDLVRLSEQESAEQERVLTGWTESYRARSADINAAIDGMARADTFQARALFAQAAEACRPVLSHGGALRLADVRHPLLDLHLKEQGSRCVPISIAIEPHDSVLVISGPNTGGKTVALKTAGLACLMAQCGLPVVARSAALPVFRQLRADIGDHQSIEADLSTFSAHVRAVSSYLDDADPPALFLFDEIGTGTEPGEGAALAQAVLERLLALRVTAIATTHHARLKSWAFTEDRVLSAAMEFDEETLRPTYRVIAGAAGVSAGIDIAGRLGLPAPLVARARELLGSAGVGVAQQMARLRELTAESEVRVESLKSREAELEASRAALARRAEDDAARQRLEAGHALAAALEEFRTLAQREVASIQDAKERARVERAQFAAEGRVRSALRARQAALAPLSQGGNSAPLTISPGAKVRILSLERDGEIVAVRGDRVEVRMGAATFSVAKDDLAARDGGAAPAAVKPKLPARPVARGSDLDDGPPAELHLLGQTVDEALPSLDRFLDASVRSGRTEVRVIHGHGTGRLRLAVRAHLKGHPHVDAFRPGGAGEGGDGATVVTLR